MASGTGTSARTLRQGGVHSHCYAPRGMPRFVAALLTAVTVAFVAAGGASAYPPGPTTTTTPPNTVETTTTLPGPTTTTAPGVTTTTDPGTTTTVPPGAPFIEVIAGSPGPVNTTFTVRVSRCIPGELVTFVLPANNDAPVTVTCIGNPTATAVLDHPAVPGTYAGSADLQTTGVVLPFTIVTTDVVVIPTTIPGTGSPFVGGTLAYGAGIVVLGAGLLIVARVRRRSTAPAA